MYRPGNRAFFIRRDRVSLEVSRPAPTARRLPTRRFFHAPASSVDRSWVLSLSRSIDRSRFLRLEQVNVCARVNRDGRTVNATAYPSRRMTNPIRQKQASLNARIIGRIIYSRYLSYVLFTVGKWLLYSRYALLVYMDPPHRTASRRNNPRSRSIDPVAAYVPDKEILSFTGS